jgi:hypothetical protein
MFGQHILLDKLNEIQFGILIIYQIEMPFSSQQLMALPHTLPHQMIVQFNYINATVLSALILV